MRKSGARAGKALLIGMLLQPMIFAEPATPEEFIKVVKDSPGRVTEVANSVLNAFSSVLGSEKRLRERAFAEKVEQRVTSPLMQIFQVVRDSLSPRKNIASWEKWIRGEWSLKFRKARKRKRKKTTSVSETSSGEGMTRAERESSYIKNELFTESDKWQSGRSFQRSAQFKRRGTLQLWYGELVLDVLNKALLDKAFTEEGRVDPAAVVELLAQGYRAGRATALLDSAFGVHAGLSDDLFRKLSPLSRSFKPEEILAYFHVGAFGGEIGNLEEALMLDKFIEEAYDALPRAFAEILNPYRRGFPLESLEEGKENSMLAELKTHVETAGLWGEKISSEVPPKMSRYMAIQSARLLLLLEDCRRAAGLFGGEIRLPAGTRFTEEDVVEAAFELSVLRKIVPLLPENEVERRVVVSAFAMEYRLRDALASAAEAGGRNDASELFLDGLDKMVSLNFGGTLGVDSGMEAVWKDVSRSTFMEHSDAAIWKSCREVLSVIISAVSKGQEVAGFWFSRRVRAFLRNYRRIKSLIL